MVVADYKLYSILLFSIYLWFTIFVYCGCDIHFSDLTDISPQSYDPVYCIYENKLSSC